jgi:hypothetical protein
VRRTQSVRAYIDLVLWSKRGQFPRLAVDLRSDEAQTAETLRADLQSELSPGHVLYGHELRVVAICPCDELVVEIDDQAVALVYLRWSGRPELPPAPDTEMLGTAERFEQHMDSYRGSHFDRGYQSER